MSMKSGGTNIVRFLCCATSRYQFLCSAARTKLWIKKIQIPKKVSSWLHTVQNLCFYLVGGSTPKRLPLSYHDFQLCCVCLKLTRILTAWMTVNGRILWAQPWKGTTEIISNFWWTRMLSYGQMQLHDNQRNLAKSAPR